MTNKPFYIIIAGSNGAGKTTFTKNNSFDCKIINPDEIARQINSNNPESVAMQAGKEAIKQINECLKTKTSFLQETTLAGKSVLKNMEKAKEKGFEVEMVYIGLENKELAKNRVEVRVAKGLHNVPKADIERRYKNSLENLSKAMDLSDRINIYDNSSKGHEEVLSMKNNNIIYLKNQLPKWLKNNLSDKYIKLISKELNKKCESIQKELNKLEGNKNQKDKSVKKDIER